MSTSIEHVTIGGENDGRFVIGNAAIARSLAQGNNWTRIRLAVRLTMDDIFAAISGTPQLWLGLLSNPASDLSNGPLGNSTSHFVGARTSNPNWTRSSTPYYDSGSGSAFDGAAVARVDSSETIVDTSGGLGPGYVGISSRQVWMLEITKGSPDFTLRALRPFWAGDTSRDQLIAAMGISTLEGVKSYFSTQSRSYYVSNGKSLAVDEAANGPLNAVCVAWDRTSPYLHLSDLMFSYFQS